MNRFFLAVLFLFFNAAYSGKASGSDLRPSEVPEKVKKSFDARYPDTYVYEWEWKRKQGLYEAEFIHKGKKYEAFFTPSGKWVRTERDMKKDEVPRIIYDRLQNSEYAGWEIDDVEEHSTPEYDLVYKIELEKGKQEIYLYLLPDGKMVQAIRKK